MAIDFGDGRAPFAYHGLCPGEILLQKLPSAIYVKLDDCGLEFLPPTACDAHQLAGYDPA